MVPGIRIRKLSLQVKEKLNNLKRRKRSNSTNDQINNGMEIIHPHFDETQPVRKSAPGEFRHNPRYDYKSWDTRESIKGESLETRLPPSSSPLQPENLFSRDEWQKKMDSAVFGSCRSRSSRATRQVDTPMTGFSEPDRQMSSAQSMPVSLEIGPHAPPPLVSFPRLSSSDLRTSGMDAPTVLQRNYTGSSTMSSLSTGSVSDGVGALNELLFATNSRIEAELRLLVGRCLDDNDHVEGLVARFEHTVDRAYRYFVTAALAVIDSESGVHPKPVSQIVHEYSSLELNPDGSGVGRVEESADCQRLEHELQQRDISQVKYSKEQMHLYAATGLTKYVSSQVLLGTGIENDLVDKLGMAVENMDKVQGQLEILESLENRYVQSESTDMAELREKAAEAQEAIERLKMEVAQAAHIRHTFETVLLEIQGL
ncbi:hypothetical protein H4R99_004522 [Coemansia sp. RSA 1722]|nr:hypothetical protein IWW45_006814 [Coemansia sp. RSA 485]KAJ2597408.1 hypothetical protein H4R99_004522 [Coemansia sp. RSA 1722]